MRIGGLQNRDDARFMKTAVAHARRLCRRCDLTSESSLLDIGCGQARLLYGLVNELGSLARYAGIDVNAASIDWLRANLEPRLPFASFAHVPYVNERYNPAGGRELALDLGEPFDCIALLSVFSHMWLADIGKYLHFVASALAPEGKVFITLFVEDDEPLETENPPDYLEPWSGPMHCVRLNKPAFERLVADAGLAIADFQYRDIAKVQSSYVLRRQ
jgi:SAM-dependent methyltransferase